MIPKVVYVDDHLIESDRVLVEDVLEMIEECAGEHELLAYNCSADFIDDLESIRSAKPHLIILDLMLPWDRKETSIPKGYNIYTGGIYLANKVREIEQLINVPIVFCSASKPDSRDGGNELKNSYWIGKHSDELQKSKKLVRSILTAQIPSLSSNQSVRKRLMNALELKPGVFGVKIDLKKVLRRAKPRK